MVQYDTIHVHIPTTRRGDLVGPTPLNSAFLFRRGGLVGVTTKVFLLVKKAGISGGPRAMDVLRKKSEIVKSLCCYQVQYRYCIAAY